MGLIEYTQGLLSSHAKSRAGDELHRLTGFGVI